MANPKEATGGATPLPEKAVRAVAEVGGVRSSDDPVPDLWSGERAGERRDATCSAGEKRREGRGDGPRGLPAPDKVRQLQITLYRKAQSKPEYRFWILYGEVQRADVLVTHDAPSSHPAGLAALDDLARAMGARMIVHGHHHITSHAEAEDGLRVLSVGAAWAVDLEGTVVWRGGKRERPLPRPRDGWVVRSVAA